MLHYCHDLVNYSDNNNVMTLGCCYIMVCSLPTIPVWLPAQCHLDAVQPVSQQEPRPSYKGGAGDASSPGAPPAPRRPGDSGRHLLGRVLPDRRLQWEDRGGGAGWPGAPPRAAARLWGALHCGMRLSGDYLHPSVDLEFVTVFDERWP